MSGQAPRSDDWSEPSHYGRGLVTVEPRLFTEVDPVPAIAMPDWQQLSDSEWDAAQPPDAPHHWGPTTYGGPRRHRPQQRTVADIANDLGADQEPVRERPPETTNRGLLASSRTMAIASLASRITGFLRNALLVAALGSAIHGVGDAYNVANNFPNMVYELLLGGVLSSVLIPLLVHAQEHDRDGGDAYTQRLLSVLVAALGVLTIAAVAAAPLIASGFVSDHSQQHLTTTFATLLLPEIFFYGLAAIYTAVLNIRHVYGPGAWAPLLNNVIVIVTVLVFWALPGPATLTPASMTTTQVLVVGIGTTLGIAAQALVLIPSLRRAGFHWQWRFRGRPNEAGRMKDAGALTGWVLAYVVASQVGVTVIAKIGVSHGGFTAFTNADLLFQMPYGILVVSLLTALMPRLSRAAARGDDAAVVADLNLGARLSAVALLPITAGFIALGPVLTTVLFAYGQNTIPQARTFGVSLAISAFGLLPFAIVMLQLRVFYAMRDGRTPTLINVFMVATKVAMVLVAGATVSDKSEIVYWLNGATSASYVIGAVAGHVLLTRRFGPLGFRRVTRTAARIGIASVAGGAVAYGVVRACAAAFGDARGGAFAGLIGGSLVGLAVVAVVVWRIRLPELADITAGLRRR